MGPSAAFTYISAKASNYMCPSYVASLVLAKSRLSGHVQQISTFYWIVYKVKHDVSVIGNLLTEYSGLRRREKLSLGVLVSGFRLNP